MSVSKVRLSFIIIRYNPFDLDANPNSNFQDKKLNLTGLGVLGNLSNLFGNFIFICNLFLFKINIYPTVSLHYFYASKISGS